MAGGWLLCALALAGCTSTPLAPPSPRPGPTQGESTAEDSDVLFTIRATTTAADGSPVRLEFVAHDPQPWDAPDRELLARSFLADCVSTDAPLSEETLGANGAELMVIEVASEPTATALAGAIDLQLGDANALRTASGEGLANLDAHGCFGRYQFASTGSLSATVDLETGSAQADPSQWRAGWYGFTTAAGSAAVLKDCTIELSQRAIDARVDQVLGWSPQDHVDGECAIGYQGE